MELIILIGLQASGKSSFRRARFDATHAVVSKDLFRNNRRPERRQHQLLHEALAAGRSVVLDNTNADVADRAPAIAVGRAFRARVIGYYFESKVSDCLRRNAGRDGANRVPDVALFSTIKRLAVPSRAEGFDELYFVRLRDDGFEVSPWLEEDADATGPVRGTDAAT